jgi:hypothetical protein
MDWKKYRIRASRHLRCRTVRRRRRTLRRWEVRDGRRER